MTDEELTAENSPIHLLKVRKTPMPNRAALVWLAAGLLLTVAGCEIEPRLSGVGAAARSELEVRYEPLAIYPEAEAVRLRVHDQGYDPEGRMRFSQPEGVQLTVAQRSRFEAAFRQARIVRRPPPGEDTDALTADACFIPHHFFEYLDRDGQSVGEVAVCFCCEGASFSPSVGHFSKDAYVDEDIAAIRTLVEDMGLPTDVECA